MQTFPPLCIYNFGLPRRTPPPHPARFSTEVDGAELTRMTTATNAAWAGRRLARRPGLGGDWHARRTSKWREVRQNGAKEKKRAGAIGEKKFRGEIHTLGLPSLNAKSFRVGLFLDFTNEFGNLQTTSNAKIICKVPCRCSKSYGTKNQIVLFCYLF